MKTPSVFGSALIIIVGLVVAGTFLPAQIKKKDAEDDVMQKFTELVLDLQKRGDTNTLARISDVIEQSFAQRDANELGLTVKVLQDLRSGRTNAAMQLLETRVDGGLMHFGLSTNREVWKPYLPILHSAKQYRTQYPHKSGEPVIDQAVEQAFQSLPK